MAARGSRRVGERPDLLTSIRAEIDVRLSELRPQIAEYERLLSAAGALASGNPSVSAPAPARARSRTGRAPRASAKTGAGTKTRARAKTQARATRASRAGKRERPAHSPTGQAIVAALEHGSHTVAELVVVTALPAPDIRDGLRRLLRHKAVAKTARDGKTAYALPAPYG
jgi:hypothetical protein